MPTPKFGYNTKDGAKVPGVTTVIGRFKDSGGLLFWAWKRGKDFPNEPLYEARDAAGDVGTYVHALIEANLRKQNSPAPPAGMTEEFVKQARSAFDAFRRWAEGLHLDIAPVEVPLVCEHERFGGTPDAVAVERDDSLSLLDWKSSKSFYFDNLIQLAAYRHLWDDARPDWKISGCIHVVRFGKEGADFEHRSFPLDHPKLARAWRQFQIFREAYDNDKYLTGKV